MIKDHWRKRVVIFAVPLTGCSLWPDLMAVIASLTERASQRPMNNKVIQVAQMDEGSGIRYGTGTTTPII